MIMIVADDDQPVRILLNALNDALRPKIERGCGRKSLEWMVSRGSAGMEGEKKTRIRTTGEIALSAAKFHLRRRSKTFESILEIVDEIGCVFESNADSNRRSKSRSELPQLD